MSETVAAAAKQVTTPESRSKSQPRLRRDCDCGQHTSGGHECDGCKNASTRLNTFDASARPPASDQPVGIDLSGIQTLTRPPDTPAVSTVDTPPEPRTTPPETAPATPEATPDDTPDASQETAPAPQPANLIVEDTEDEARTGQLRKTDFLDQLETAVRAEADAALAGTVRSTTDCPYLTFWFTHYRGKSSDHVEQALRRYAPETRTAHTAAEYVPLVAARVRQGVDHWVRTGTLTGVPDDVPAGLLPRRGDEGPLFKAHAGGARATADPAALRARLGAGTPLDSKVRSRMESVFGRSFARVRTHTDTTGSRLAGEQNARAFTVGDHVAFGPGEYRPGTVFGDALIAHELAHVAQQGGGTPTAAERVGGASRAALETDADRSAVHAMVSLYDRTKDGAGALTRNVLPSLRSGLRLQRCKKGGPRRGEVEAGPTYTPSGTIAPTVSGGRKSADFTMAATFKNDPAHGIYASCCEVRQYIQWSAGEIPNHPGFQPATSFNADTWYEDRDSADKRYGHRSGPYSDPGPGDEYLDDSGSQDQANGRVYAGSDSPETTAARTGEWRFQLRVVDTANGNREIGGTDNITLDF